MKLKSLVGKYLHSHRFPKNPSKPVEKFEAAYRLAAAAVKLATGDPEEACAAGMGWCLAPPQ